MIEGISISYKKEIDMKALVSHPDVIRWFMWNWKTNDKETHHVSLVRLLNTVCFSKLDISITNTTITIFSGNPMPIHGAPCVIKQIFDILTQHKGLFFDSVITNHIFRNISCTQFKKNDSLEHTIDRLGWVSWIIWWSIQLEPSKFFIIKDIFLIALFDSKNYCPRSKNKLPKPPWIKIIPKDIQSIYTQLNNSIYDKCFVS